MGKVLFSLCQVFKWHIIIAISVRKFYILIEETADTAFLKVKYTVVLFYDVGGSKNNKSENFYTS